MHNNPDPSAEQMSHSEETKSDLELWEKVRLGDIAAFSSLFKRYYVRLYHFAGRFLKDIQAAENIVQDLFVVLWTERENLQIKSTVKSYLYTSVKNRSFNYLKRQQRLISDEEEPVQMKSLIPNPEENYLQKEWQTAVYQAIDHLPDRCREIYLMKRYDNLKYHEIADILNISVNTVKTQMKRALQSLYKQLTQFTSLFVPLV
jgi:RNA polymerase sigma-70 factor (ECF subfamily)